MNGSCDKKHNIVFIVIFGDGDIVLNTMGDYMEEHGKEAKIFKKEIIV